MSTQQERESEMKHRSNLALQPEAETCRRDSHRREIYWNEGLEVSIETEVANIDGRIVNISIGGLAMYTKCDDVDQALKVNDVVNLGISVNKQKSVEILGRVAHFTNGSYAQSEGMVVGFEYLNRLIPRDLRPRRREKRFAVRQFFAPTAVAKDPLLFYENVFFQVESISSRGLGLLTSIRNKSMLPDVELDLSLAIPTGQKIRIPVKVVHSHNLIEQEMLLVGVEIKEGYNPQRFHEAISEYLFAATDVSVKELSDAGFVLGDTDQGLSFSFVNTKEDWSDVLNLRLQAYKSVGKFPKAKTAAEMADKYDAFARQIVCRIHGKIVAAGRIVFCEGIRERSEHVGIGLDIPNWLFEGGVCEFSRTCIDPDYRGSDIFVKLISYMGKVGFESNYGYSLVNCNANTIGTYKSAGYEELGISFDGFGAKDCQVVYLDLKKLVQGKVGGVVGFNQVVYPIVEFTKKRHLGKFAPKIQLWLHKIAYPFLKRIRNSRRNRKLRSEVSSSK